jgi:NRAMP (natural resistance-associated macrophage protein)-like metal ion transporter
MTLQIANRRRAEPRETVVRAPFGPSAERRSVLDRAHRGDIEGALGRIPVFDTGPRLSRRRHLTTLLAVTGPGLLVMIADNDAGGLSVYAQAGQDYGLSLLWLLLLLAAVLFVTQEMVARLGAVTGAGHARLIFERFGRRWGAFALSDLLALNLLTLVTNFIGLGLALDYLGISRHIAIPVAAAALIVATASGSFRRWERTMGVLVLVNLLVIPLALVSTSDAGALARGVVPGVEGGLHATALVFVIALVGTTVAPWQLFFHQSNVVDKRIAARWVGYERVDTLIGTLIFTVIAVSVLAICAFAFDGPAEHGSFVDAGAVASGLEHSLGAPAGVIFALLLLNGSILGAGVVTLATSYALGDVFGVKHSLHRSWRDARFFHGSFAACVAIAALVVLLPGVPLGFVTTAVQALAGVLLPSATVFLLLLCNDRDVLGPWTNPRWLNAIAAIVVGFLLVLSALLTFSILLPTKDLPAIAAALLITVAVGLAALGLASHRGRRSAADVVATPWERATWTMPPIEALPPPSRSRARALGLGVLRSYLAIASLVLVFHLIQALSAA